MMYPEFQALFEKAKPDAPMPNPEAYHESIEPFYMASNMDKAEFVKLYAKMPVLVDNISGEIASVRRALNKKTDALKLVQENAAKAEAQFKETVDAMAKRQKELEEKVAMLSKERDDLGDKVASLFAEINRLRDRYARLVRGLCDKCFSKVLFGEAAETEEND